MIILVILVVLLVTIPALCIFAVLENRRIKMMPLALKQPSDGVPSYVRVITNPTPKQIESAHNRKVRVQDWWTNER